MRWRRPRRWILVLWLIGGPLTAALYRATNHVCGPAGLGPGATCTPAEDYYPTLIGIFLLWYAGLVVAGFISLSRRMR